MPTPTAYRICLLLLWLFTAGSHRSAAEVRIWSFEATVTEIDDEDQLLGDVRLGDTVKGSFAYDLDNPGYLDGPESAWYDHPTQFAGVEVELINPRTEMTQVWLPQPTFEVSVTECLIFTDCHDAVIMYQSVLPPRPALNDWLFVQFSGPEVIDDLNLPTEWILDDWPFGIVAIGAAGILDGITAQIYEITPILAGDFNRDDKVDAQDYEKWKSEFGADATSWADGNRDGVVNLADYTSWRNNLGSVAAAMDPGSQKIPEPMGGALLGVCLLAWHVGRNRGCTV
ncbi:hypothetical protein NG895_18720 [Aeoliella sp. ICT_H6.2]|uniref:PEP-CTERM protein-sorting domain-containing protein n=1 Tax=Aeoliella straminimaris TaxID=2954799 RepID=A0A9X2FD05_9BACT|nr:hypothetical protein [Aeoliella straminimaris]MCO6045938.1 hypothetical protein [Aeoliella straminimaris]